MEKFIIYLGLGLLIYLVLTSPMISLMLFGVGIKYSTYAILGCCLIANIASILIVNKFYKK